LIIHFVGL